MRWEQRVACGVLRHAAHVPRHVAFIMDGNRRYAKQQHVHTAQGHYSGYEKLKQTLEWCLELGVRMVTVYAFSIDNFKRSPEEVAQLMELAKNKFIEMIQRLDMVEKYGCCVRVLGDLSLLPPDVRAAMSEAVEASRHKTRVTLNICMSYTHQREVAQAGEMVQRALGEGVILADDVDAALMQRALYTGISAALASEAAAAAAAAAASSCPATAADAYNYSGSGGGCGGCGCVDDSDPSEWCDDDECSSPHSVPSTPDLLIRTSGETRLSDFLCYQSSAGETQLSFTPTLWPDFSLLELGRLMLEFQRVAPALQRRRRERLQRERRERQHSDVEQVRRIIVAERRAAAAHERRERERRRHAEAALLYADGEEEDSEEERCSSGGGGSGCGGGLDGPPSAASAGACATAAAGAVAVRSASAASLTTSEESSSGDDIDAEADADADAFSERTPLHSPCPSPCASAAAAAVCAPAAPATPPPLAYWRTGDVVESVLHTRRSPSVPTSPSHAHAHALQHARYGDAAAFAPHRHDDEQADPTHVDEEELRRRVRLYAAQRHQRLRAFTLFARKHTSSLI